MNATEHEELEPTAEAAADAQPADVESELQQEVERLKNENLRLIAEARNSQQRAQRELTERMRFAEADFARDLLTILDDFERTIAASEQERDEGTLLAGTKIIYDSFLKFLEKRNIVPIESVGAAFDPEVHEALLHQPSADHDAGVVSQEIARGYRLHDRVIRPARVVVSSGAEGAGA